MVSKDNPHIEQFAVALEGWTDERFVTRKQLWSFAMFNMYLVNLSETQGWRYDGHSLKYGAQMCTLTVRATIDEVPYVVFTSGLTPAACVCIVVRKIEEGLLEWVKDKYR